MRSAKRALPQVVFTPAVSIRSFKPIGMPCNGQRQLPALISASAARAWARALSFMTVIKALILGLSCSIRSRQALMSSTGEICFRRSRSEASAIVNSVIVEPAILRLFLLFHLVFDLAVVLLAITILGVVLIWTIAHS